MKQGSTPWVITSAFVCGAFIVGVAWLMHRYLEMGGRSAMVLSFGLWLLINWTVSRRGTRKE
jgi:hypothetical protein